MNSCTFYVFKNVAVKAVYPTADELKSMEYRSKIDFTDGVRVVVIDGYDSCACCAPHVPETGNIGCFKIVDFYKLNIPFYYF